MVAIPQTGTVQPGAFGGFDDEERVGNLGVPSGALVARYVSALNGIAASGRIIRTFWGGDSTNNAAAIRRFLWDHKHGGASRIRIVLLVVRKNGTYNAAQAIEIGGDDHNLHTFGPTDYATLYDLSGTTARALDSTGLEVMSFEVTPTDQGIFEMTLGSLTTNGVAILAGLVYECPETVQDPSVIGAYTPHDHVAPGRDIIAAAVSGSGSDLATFRTNLNHTTARKRPMIGWDAINPGTTGTGYVDFATSTQAYRYIHDQTVGDGGTAPASTGPAITMPLYKAATGINATVRLQVRVYAALSGATNQGKVGVSHSNGAGGMTSIVDLITAISGTTYAWYPALTTTAATFLGRADIPYERIVLAAKSTGATDKIRIGAYSIGVLPALNVT